MQKWTATSLDELEKVSKSVFESVVQEESLDCATVIALHGDLGAGKTTFVQMLGKDFGVMETITSPTFVIMKLYDIELNRFQKFIHIDAYRIEEIDEMRVLGFESLLAQKDTIICIEWAERIAELLPEHARHLTFAITGETRSIELKEIQSKVKS